MRKVLLVLPSIVIVTTGLIQFVPVSREEPVRVASRDLHDNPMSRAIHARLVDALGPDASGIVVGVEDNVAVLSGDVRDGAALRRAEEVASSVEGILVVHNFLEPVAGLAEPDAIQPAHMAAGVPDMTVVDLMTPVGIEK
jgi:hypothetical protein